jgi:hypothetical protein
MLCFDSSITPSSFCFLFMYYSYSTLMVWSQVSLIFPEPTYKPSVFWFSPFASKTNSKLFKI